MPAMRFSSSASRSSMPSAMPDSRPRARSSVFASSTGAEPCTSASAIASNAASLAARVITASPMAAPRARFATSSTSSALVMPRLSRERAVPRKRALPAEVQRLALGVAGGALYPHHRTLVQLADGSGSGIGARAAHAGHEAIEQVLDARPLVVEVHPGRRDPLFEQRLAGAVESCVPLGTATHRPCRGHPERLLEQPAVGIAVHVTRRLVCAGEPRPDHHVRRAGGQRERDVTRVTHASVGPCVPSQPPRLGGALQHGGELWPP